ncbi:hypothetical protein P8452_52004 [Trifolium repens]|nr:hypothetical protein P8452_52004 [Trifolium repens]
MYRELPALKGFVASELEDLIHLTQDLSHKTFMLPSCSDCQSGLDLDHEGSWFGEQEEGVCSGRHRCV